MLMKFVSSSLSKPPLPLLSHTQISFQLLSHRPGGHLSLRRLRLSPSPAAFSLPSPHRLPPLGGVGALAPWCLPSHLRPAIPTL